MGTDSIPHSDEKGRLSFYLEPAWVFFDQISSAGRTSLPFNSKYVEDLPLSFDFRIGLSSKPDRFFRFNTDLGFGYS